MSEVNDFDRKLKGFLQQQRVVGVNFMKVVASKQLNKNVRAAEEELRISEERLVALRAELLPLMTNSAVQDRISGLIGISPKAEHNKGQHAALLREAIDELVRATERRDSKAFEEHVKAFRTSFPNLPR